MIFLIRRIYLFPLLIIIFLVAYLTFRELQTEFSNSVQSNPGIVKIYAAGDIMLGRYLTEYLEQNGKDYFYPFKRAKNIFSGDGVVFGNLEGPITAQTKSLTGIERGGKYILKNPVPALEAIKDCGFNLLSLANNHILDYYEAGLLETISLLEANNIAHAGAGRNLAAARKPAVIERGSLKVGLLSYTDMAEILYKGNPPYRFGAGDLKPGVNPRPPAFNETIKKELKEARGQVDLLMVSLHWGVEESFTVLKNQRDFAHRLVDNGADLILGTHPHQFQGIEIYHGKPIIYSLGNFIFDQDDPENKESFIMKLLFEENKLVGMKGIPVKIINYQVVPVFGPEAAAQLEREKMLCRKLKTSCIIRNNQLIFEI
ncbi:MAG: CapA family protein [Bacillota bacterium]